MQLVQESFVWHLRSVTSTDKNQIFNESCKGNNKKKFITNKCTYIQTIKRDCQLYTLQIVRNMIILLPSVNWLRWCNYCIIRSIIIKNRIIHRVHRWRRFSNFYIWKTTHYWICKKTLFPYTFLCQLIKKFF